MNRLLLDKCFRTLCASSIKFNGVYPLTRSKTSQVVNARAFISYSLRSCGFTIQEIACVFGRSVHGVHYLLKKMSLVVSSPSYHSEYKLWLEYKSIISPKLKRMFGYDVFK